MFYLPGVKGSLSVGDMINNDMDGVLLDYESWLDHHNFIVFKGLVEGKVIKKAVMLPKRGDAIYSVKTSERLDKFRSTLPTMEFFDSTDYYHEHRTPLLKFTLTYHRDHPCGEHCFKKGHHFHSRYDAWVDTGKDLNRFLSCLRRRYGKISQIRSWESHEDGYPHVNVNVLFREVDFSVKWMDFVFGGRKRNGAFRVIEKRSFEKYWKHGHIDLMGMTGVDGSLDSYSEGSTKLTLMHDVKYITKDYTSPDAHIGYKARFQMAVLWKLRKRAYSMGYRRRDKQGNVVVPSFGDVLMGMVFGESISYCVNSNIDGVKVQGNWERVGIFTDDDDIIRDAHPPPGALSFNIPMGIAVSN